MKKQNEIEIALIKQNYEKRLSMQLLHRDTMNIH